MLPVTELVTLFTGDTLSLGFASEELVCEICARSAATTPVTPEWVKELVYPGVAKENLDAGVYEIFVDGVRLWTKRHKPRRHV